MKEKIKEFVHTNDYVSFAEITKVIPHSAGERVIHSENDSIIIWEGVSEEFSQAIQDLLRDREIHMAPCSPMVYTVDGGMIPPYPVAKSIRKFAKPRWLPVTLRPG